MSVSHTAKNFRYPTFEGDQVQCISDVELWIKRYQYTPSGQQVCYQVSEGPVVCYLGDDFTITQEQDPTAFYNCNYSFKLKTPGTSNYFSYANPRTGSQNNVRGTIDQLSLAGNGCPTISNNTFVYFCGKDENGNNRKTQVNLPFGQFGFSVQLEQVSLNCTRINGTDPYKIEIFLNNELVHEHTSENTITAWIEESPEKCSLESSQWELYASWRQLPTDKVITWLDGNSLYFAIESQFFNPPSNRKFGSKKPIGFITQSYLVAGLHKDEDCQFPLYQLRPKPLLGTECNPEPRKICPPNYIWSEKLNKCIYDEKPRCPVGTHSQYECKGYLCCYDECGNLILSKKL